MRKSIALLIVLLLTLCSPLTVDLAWAQNNTPIPEFTLRIADDSYNVAPTFTIDPYTGQNLTTQAGYHVEKRFIEVIIKNPSIPSTYVNGSLVQLFYNIRVKGHYQIWGGESTSGDNLAPSESEYTTIRYGFGQENPDPGGFSIWLGYIAPGGMVDFEVEAITGYYTKVLGTPDICFRNPEYNVFTQTGKSGWSEAQTLTIDPVPTLNPTPSYTLSPTTESPQTPPSESASPFISPSATPKPTPTTSSSQPAGIDFGALTVIAVAVLVIAVASGAIVALMLRRKTKRNVKL